MAPSERAWTAVERVVRDGVASGLAVELEGPEESRAVRGEVLSAILLSGGAALKGARRLRISRMVVTGRLDLAYAEAPLNVHLTDSIFREPPDFTSARLDSLSLRGSFVPGLDAIGLQTRGDVDLSEGFRSEGPLTLTSARIGGTLYLVGAWVHSPGQRAIDASWMRVDGQLHAARLVVGGTVQLIGTRIGGMMSLWDASLSEATGICLNGERLDVAESLFMKGTFRSEGVIVLRNAHIGGGLDMRGATLGRGPRLGRSLSANRIVVGRSVACIRGFCASGTMLLSNASVGGRLSFDDARLEATGGFALDVSGSRAADLVLTFREKPVAAVDLRGLDVLSIRDEPVTWPDSIYLTDLAYQRLGSAGETDVKERLAWLSRNPTGYLPQAYERLANAFEAEGRPDKARQTRLANEKARTASGDRWARMWGSVLDITVGYGYQPWKAAVWLLVFVAAAGTFFHFSPPSATPDSSGASYNPYIFALDVLLPVIDLRQEALWAPTGVGQWVAWLLALSGWAITAAIVAGASRLLQRK